MRVSGLWKHYWRIAEMTCTGKNIDKLYRMKTLAKATSSVHNRCDLLPNERFWVKMIKLMHKKL